MLVEIFGSLVFGINAAIITIKADVTKDFKFFLVGLPDIAVKKISKEGRNPKNLLALINKFHPM